MTALTLCLQRLDFPVFGSTKVFIELNFTTAVVLLWFLKPNLIWSSFFFSVQWTVGGTKGKKKVKQGKGSDKKNATKKKVNKATASGSSDGDSSAESSAPEEGECPGFVGSNPSSAGMWLNFSVSDYYVWKDPQNAWISHNQLILCEAAWQSVSRGVDYTDNQDVLCHSLRLGDSLAHPPLYRKSELQNQDSKI